MAALGGFFDGTGKRVQTADGKLVGFIDHFADRVGKARVFHTVDHDRSYRHLPWKGSPRLRRR